MRGRERETKQQPTETKKLTSGGKGSFVGNPVRAKQAELYHELKQSAHFPDGHYRLARKPK